MILCPFDDAKVSRIYGDWMALKMAFSDIPCLSLKFSDILCSAMLRAQKKHQNRIDSDAYTYAVVNLLFISYSTS